MDINKQLPNEIIIIGRNIEAKIKCCKCKQYAKLICSYCCELYCNKCYSKTNHKCNSDEPLTLLNTPRTGICGYDEDCVNEDYVYFDDLL